MKPQILIVDDDIIILRLLNFILSPLYNIVSKSSGIDAFRWLEEGNHPDLIISDLLMPYFSGTSFVRNLKVSGFYRDTPVIVLSGAERLGEIINEMPFKVEGYLQKPFNPASLKSIIADIIKNQPKNAIKYAG